MRLHILPDEKIINRTICYFEKVYPNENKYYILLGGIKDVPARVDTGVNPLIVYGHFDTDQFWEEIGNINSYSHVIIHYLTPDAAKFVSKINHNNIYWIEWGGDLYNTLLNYKGYRLYSDDKLIAKLKYPILPYWTYQIIKKRRQKKILDILYKAILKIKYFVPDSMYDEYPLLLKYYPDFSFLKYKEFFYYPIQEIMGGLVSQITKGNSLFVGNSASFTNNHPTVLNHLSKLGINKDIIMPLSYGGNSRYVNYVVNQGKKLFGSHFHPIMDYLPLDEYNRLLLSANVFVFGNLRQEAVGNIIIALYIGGRVYLDDNNPLLPFYKAKGLTIFSIQEMIKADLNSSLDEDVIYRNRAILDSLYSNERLLSLIQNSFGDE